MRDIAFVIERPLQFLVFLCIKKQLPNNSEITLHIADVFEGAVSLYENLKKINKIGFSTSIYKSYKEALEGAAQRELDVLFIHWDVGFRTDFRFAKYKFLRKVKNISVFEEGISVDRMDVFSPFKRRIFDFFGFSTHVGGNRFVDEIFVFEPLSYKIKFGRVNKKISQISHTILWLLKNEQDFLLRVFPFDLRCMDVVNERCVLYLSNWKFQEEILDAVLVENKDCYLKLHPYLKGVRLNGNTPIQQIPSDIPAEIVIFMLLKIYDEVCVAHHGSSVEKYISDPRLQFLNI